jgi:transposase
MAFPAQGGPDPHYRRDDTSSVLSDITGAGGRAIINALINGERAPQSLAELAIRRARSKIWALSKPGRNFTGHQAFMCRHYLDESDHLAPVVSQLDTRITALPTGWSVTRTSRTST